jgi:hypothetical protein
MSTPARALANGPTAANAASKLVLGTTTNSISAWPSARRPSSRASKTTLPASNGVCRSISKRSTSCRRSIAAAGISIRRRRPLLAGSTSQRGKSMICGLSTDASGSLAWPGSGSGK